MRAAWEWRCFWRADQGDDLGDWAAEIAAALRLEAPGPIGTDMDTYLVLPQLRHNLKLRSGSLEVKWQVGQAPEGLSLWKDKEVWVFPLAAEQVTALRAALPAPGSLAGSAGQSAHHLIRALQTTYPELEVVTVPKRRVRFDTGPARLELAQLELLGISRWLSVCVDGYDHTAVRDLAARVPLKTGYRSVSYVELLREAIWWFPAQARGEAVSRGHHSA